MTDAFKCDTYARIKDILMNNADKDYDAFNSRIVKSEYPTVGVRTPVIKKLAKNTPIENREKILDEFMRDKDKTYELVLYAGCLAARKSAHYGQTRDYLSALVPLFGSWAHVDCVTPLLTWADRAALWRDFRYLLDADGQYQKRFYIMIMFSCCLNDEYVDSILDTLRRDVRYGQYYVDMASAWLLAECLIKYYDKTLPLFETREFPRFVHNKALQKARESFRIPPDIKEYLNTLKIKS